MRVNGEEDQGLHSGAPHKLEAGDKFAKDVKKEQPVRWEGAQAKPSEESVSGRRELESKKKWVLKSVHWIWQGRKLFGDLDKNWTELEWWWYLEKATYNGA